MTDFQFLRPLWLLLLLLVPLVYLVMARHPSGSNPWHRVIPEPLLRPLIPRDTDTSQSRRRWRLLPPTLLTLAALALAGPSFRTGPVPLQQQDDALVVVLDLSLSMLATDSEPNRLTRAIRKIRDLLVAREGAFTGLVVYAADGHVVTPLTDDRRTVEGMLTALDPMIMPAAGNRADLGVAQASELLRRGAAGRGRILLITDGISARHGSRIRAQLSDTPWQLDGLLVGTEEGAPIPLPNRGFIRDGDQVVIARASLEALAETANATGGQARALSVSDQDIRQLRLGAEDHDQWRAARSERHSERRQDDGYWLLWLLVPLALLGWRRGALTLIACTIYFAPSAPAQALEWQDLWQTPEQRAPVLIEQDPESAAGKLRDPQWRGTALYRAQQYQQAADAFANGRSANAHYNRGNALIRAGKTEAALAAWNKALELDPSHEAARHNRDLVQDSLEQQQQQQQSQTSADPSESQQGDGGESGPPPQPQPGDGADSQPSPGNANQPPAEPAGDQANATGADPRTEDPTSEQAQAPNDDGSSPGQSQEAAGQPDKAGEQELTQSQQQWLRRIPDDPGGLLRRKFLQQSRSRQIQPDENDTPW